MVLQVLLEGLRHPAPSARVEMLRVLAMLEETQALPALKTMMSAETEPDVQSTIKWAGSVIYQAHQKGYSTESAVRTFFRLDRGPTPEELEEEKKLNELKEMARLDLVRGRESEMGGAITQNLLLAGSLGGLSGLASGLSSAASMMVDTTNMMNEGLDKPRLGGAIDPQRPTDSDINLWVKRLREGDSKMRKNAAIELRTLNNLAAMPHLGRAFALDPDPEIKQQAQQSGKSLYFNWVRWEQVQAEERGQVAKRTQSAPLVNPGGAAPAQPAEPKDTGPSPSEAADILAKAQAAREARAKKKSGRLG